MKTKQITVIEAVSCWHSIISDKCFDNLKIKQKRASVKIYATRDRARWPVLPRLAVRADVISRMDQSKIPTALAHARFLPIFQPFWKVLLLATKTAESPERSHKK